VIVEAVPQDMEVHAIVQVKCGELTLAPEFAVGAAEDQHMAS
jgi:hypothetical protein